MSVVLPLRGVTALSDFRVEKLLQKAAALGLPEVKLKSEFWYFVGSEKALDAATVEKLQALLAAQSVKETPEAREGLHLFLGNAPFGYDFAVGFQSDQYRGKLRFGRNRAHRTRHGSVAGRSSE